jgi:phthalate 4,5-dioxygenase oxygenase subunit
MLSHDENELMCRVGPRSAMGAIFRRHWLPVLESAELPAPDGDPVAVHVLGEHFVAFRDTNGQVGLLDEHCCHRGASLLLGRVEGCGIRCIYHGWKFGADGTVLETPNVPDAKFRTRVRARAYPVQERGGLIWAYFGDPKEKPALPDWPWMNLPAANRINAYAVVNCNYVQLMEGLVDSSHLNILHGSGLQSASDSTLDFASRVAGMQIDSTPRIEAEETEFGFHYAAIRSQQSADGSVQRSARIAAFITPCFIANPNGDLLFAIVPMDDTRTLFMHVWWDATRPIGEEPLRSEQLKFVGLDEQTLSQYGMTKATCDSPARPSRANYYLQDRASMRAGRHFTGLPSFTQEDAAVVISAGEIRDRTKEMLSVADVAVGKLYRVLLKAARSVSDRRAGLVPSADTLAHVVGIDGALDADQHWQELVPSHRRAVSESSYT